MASSLPASIRQVASFLERLPGIGHKTANRMAFSILRMPERDLQAFGEAVAQLKTRTKRCAVCHNLTEDEICSICSNPERDHATVTVVEDVIDLLSFETGNIYNGVYHVLHGKIDPLNHIGPDDIFIDTLLKRIRSSSDQPITELILAMNPDMEGEATAMYIRNAVNAISEQATNASTGLSTDTERDEDAPGQHNRSNDDAPTTTVTIPTITRLGYGLPIGGNLEYADYMTLRKAFENRSRFSE